MVTDRDIVIRSVAEDKDHNTTQVKDIMSVPAIYCLELTVSIKPLKLCRRNWSLSTVLNLDMKLVGIFSSGDIAVRSAREVTCGEVLEKVSQKSIETLCLSNMIERWKYKEGISHYSFFACFPIFLGFDLHWESSRI